MIENAFNPTNRPVEEIEKYLETLLKAYEIELEAIRRRTKVNRTSFFPHSSQLYMFFLECVSTTYG